MSFRKSVALCAAVLVLSPGATGPLFAADREPYRLLPGDTLSFSVLFFPELARVVPVDVDGRVFLPLVGAIDAEGLSLDELRDAVDLRLRQQPVHLPGPEGRIEAGRTLVATEVMIDIAEYRPVYLSGAVAEPGEIAYRPGMTVRQAIAQAGGIGLSTDEFDDLRLLELRARRDDIAGQVAAHRDRIARLQADLGQLGANGATAPEAGADAEDALFAGGVGMDRVASAWLTARNTLRTSERQQIEATIKQMRGRLDVLVDLKRVGDELVAATEAELARVSDLRQRGFGREEPVSAAREDLLLASSRALDTANELLRLREAITETEGDLSMLDIEERVELVEGIEAEVFDLARLEKLLGSLDRNLRLVGVGSGEGTTRAVIRRYESGKGAEAVAVSPDDALMPGDVIEVVLEDPEAAGAH